jgi:cytochrome c oxidase cbb3-type subunit 1
MSLLSSANVLPGVLAPVINFWYVDAFIMLWMLPIALAVFLFLVPKMTGEPLANYSYPHLAFWMFALLGGLLGARHLVHLPVPDWLVTMSIAASVLTAIPALMIAYSVIPPLGKAYGLFGQSVALRFLGFGFAAFLVFTVVGAFTSMEFIKGITQFTLASDAYFYLALYCFPSMIFVGAIYYVLPKVLGVEWHSRKLSELHYWGTLFSVTFLTVFMFAGGAAQGNVLSEPENFMATSVRQAEIITFVGQWFWVVIVITNFLFLVNLIRSILDYYNPSSAIKEAFVTPKSEGSSTGSSNNSGETKTAASTA